MKKQWQELKETIIEIRDNNKFDNKDVSEICKFLTNYMGVLEEQMQESCEMTVEDKKEPCGDVVSRQFMYELGATCIATRDKNNKLIALGTIESLPPVKPIHRDRTVQEFVDKCRECGNQKKGKWISVNTGKQSHTKDGMTIESVKCSECSEWLTASDEYACYGRYCPNCGAKMESED